MRPRWRMSPRGQAVSEVIPRRRRGRGPEGSGTAGAYRQGLGIAKGSASSWLKRAEIEDGHRPDLTDADRAELRELKRRNRLLKQENEVRLRAAAHLSPANLPGK